MARKTAVAKITNLEQVKDRVLAKVTASTLYVRKLDEELHKRAELADAVAGEHYENVLRQIHDEVLLEGVSPATSGRTQLTVKSPEGPAGVQLNWSPLSKRWLANKRYRAGAGYKFNPNRATRGTIGAVRGRSYGPNAFWLDERKLARAFKSSVMGKGKARVYYTRTELTNGDYAVEFVVTFNRLPARYLDVAIRRSLLRGATGMGSLGGLVDLPISLLPTGDRARGIYRGGWPEYHRPMMRPIAQRLGRAMKVQILKSLNRR